MRTTICYVLLTALRDRLFATTLLLLTVAYFLAQFLGSNAIVEGQQLTMVYVAGFTRVILHVCLIVFICFYIKRAFENREIDMMLTRPVARHELILAFWLGFSLISIAFILLICGGLFLLSPDITALAVWGVQLFLEAMVVIALSLFAAFILKSAVSSVMFCFAFYGLTRIMGFFLYILNKPTIHDWSLFGKITEWTLGVVSAILPRLDLLAQSELLVHSTIEPYSVMIALIQPVLAIGILLTAATIDLQRKQF